MNSAWVDILQAWGSVASSSATVVTMVPVYAAIWALSWLAGEQQPPSCQERTPSVRSAAK